MNIYPIPRWNGVYVFDGNGAKLGFLDIDPSVGIRAIQEAVSSVYDGDIVPIGSRDWKEFVSRLDYELPAGPEMHTAAVREAENALRSAITEDQQMVQGVRAVDDMNMMLNLISERAREWYALYFPEACSAEDTVLMPLLSENPERSSIAEALGIDHTSTRGTSVISEADLSAISSLASLWMEMHSARERMESYIRRRAGEILPHMCEIVGPVLSAHLVSEAGSLERLARMPSSTIQVLGAEKALFKHLRSGTAPPKHGLIFQHPSIHSAPRWRRGRIARAMAGKIAIAARMDYFSSSEDSAALSASLEARLEEINRIPEPQDSERKYRAMDEEREKDRLREKRRRGGNRSGRGSPRRGTSDDKHRGRRFKSRNKN